MQIPRPNNVHDVVSSKVRFDGENFVSYKKRIALENKFIKLYCRGRMFHDSSAKGTYKKA